MCAGHFHENSSLPIQQGRKPRSSLHRCPTLAGNYISSRFYSRCMPNTTNGADMDVVELRGVGDPTEIYRPLPVNTVMIISLRSATSRIKQASRQQSFMFTALGFAGRFRVIRAILPRVSKVIWSFMRDIIAVYVKGGKVGRRQGHTRGPQMPLLAWSKSIRM